MTAYTTGRVEAKSEANPDSTPVTSLAAKALACPLFQTHHARVRWQERVGQGSLAEFLRAGRVSGRPPKWAVRYREGVGLGYVLNADYPGVVAVCRDVVVLTVLTRQVACAVRVWGQVA